MARLSHENPFDKRVVEEKKMAKFFIEVDSLSDTVLVDDLLKNKNSELDPNQQRLLEKLFDEEIVDRNFITNISLAFKFKNQKVLNDALMFLNKRTNCSCTGRLGKPLNFVICTDRYPFELVISDFIEPLIKSYSRFLGVSQKEHSFEFNAFNPNKGVGVEPDEVLNFLEKYGSQVTFLTFSNFSTLNNNLLERCFRLCPKIESFTLYDNGKISKECLHRCLNNNQYLKKITLKGCLIVDCLELDRFKKLKYVYVFSCKKMKNIQFLRCPSLKYVYIQHCDDLERVGFEKCPKIRDLMIDYGKISSLNLLNQERLVNLSLSHLACLKSIVGFNKLKRMKSLNIINCMGLSIDIDPSDFKDIRLSR